jgi:protoporphyrinogen oxidase
MQGRPKEKIALIIGAGPAGLTAAYEILAQKMNFKPIVVEATDRIGGISCTIDYKGNRIDIGGHRFFSKSDTVMDWWIARMPIQGSPSRDDKALEREKLWNINGPNPDAVDRVMLIRERISRIFYLRKFFDYPISLRVETITNLGLLRTAKAGLGYIRAQIFKRIKEESLEDFLVNRFGKPLYRMFFESYTEKVWGVHPRQISSAWGAQRIKGLSLSKAVFKGLQKLFFNKESEDLRQKSTETSLIEQFLYPKLGPGQLWECVADDVKMMGGGILLNYKVIGINIQDSSVVSVTIENEGNKSTILCDECLSTMPIKDLIACFNGGNIPDAVKKIAYELPYRDFMTVGVLVDRLEIKNETKIKTYNNIVPDTWIYIQEPDVKLCRLQIFNNWSPYMVQDPGKVWIGLEYMCSEDDDIWKMVDEDFIELAIDELERIGIINRKSIVDTCRIRIEKAYPAYFGSYSEFDKIREYLDGIVNLYCMGRNGQHRYNNQDHSMLTAMEAVRAIGVGDRSKNYLWEINTEQEYHEEKQ